MAIAGSGTVTLILSEKNPSNPSHRSSLSDSQMSSFKPSNCGLCFSNENIVRASLSKLYFPVPILKNSTRGGVGVARCSMSSSRPASQPRFIQLKLEASWFNRFLSIIYDHVINPGHWIEDMRDDPLEPADLWNRDLTILDVGGGTGFATLGMVKHADANNITILDQYPHQLAKAKEKEPLKE